MGNIVRIKGSGRQDYNYIVSQKQKYDPTFKVGASLGTTLNTMQMQLERATLYVIEAGHKDNVNSILNVAMSIKLWNQISNVQSTLRTVILYGNGIRYHDAMRMMCARAAGIADSSNWPIDDLKLEAAKAGFDWEALDQIVIVPIERGFDSRISPRKIGKCYDKLESATFNRNHITYSYDPIAILIDDIGYMDQTAIAALAADCDIPIVAMSYHLPEFP